MMKGAAKSYWFRFSLNGEKIMHTPTQRALCAVFSLSLIVLFSLPAPARVGDRLEDVMKTDFFKFFNLVETDRLKDERQRAVVNFRPGAGNFRNLVTVIVTLDDDNRIYAMGLLLDRSFVDHKTNGLFARDISKSFLRSAIPQADEASIANLANEIEYPKESEGYRIIRMKTKPDPELPAQPTQGYLTYLGKRKVYMQDLSKSYLLLQNIKAGAVDSLLISINARQSVKT